MRTNTFETYNLLTGYIELPDVKLRVVGSEFAVRKINFLSYIYIFWRRIEHRVTRLFNWGSTISCEIIKLESDEIKEDEKVPVSNHGFNACVV